MDGVVFDRPHPERLLGLERFKETRIECLPEDLRDFFPYQSVYYFDGKPDSVGSLFASKKEIAPFLREETMSDRERLKAIPQKGPRLYMFKIWPVLKEVNGFQGLDVAAPFFADAANYDGRFLAAYLSLLAQGQISPKALPPLSKD